MVPATPVGLRDRVIILTLVFTGRRGAEVLGMTAGSISVDGTTDFYSYRGKGGKAGKRELPRPACEAIWQWLECVGKDPATMQPDESLWLPREAGAASRAGRSIPTCGATRRRRACRRVVCTSSGIQPQGAGAMWERQSKTCRGSSTTPAWGSDDDLPAASRGSGGPELGEVAEGDRGLVCDAPFIQFHQLQAVRSDDRDRRCSRSPAATFCLVANGQ